MLEWGEDEVPDSVEAAEINKRLFNEDTVDRVIAHFMEKGIKVEGGDRLGKTIVFAKNQDARRVHRAARFNARLSGAQGPLRPRHHLQDRRLCAEPDRRLLGG